MKTNGEMIEEMVNVGRAVTDAGRRLVDLETQWPDEEAEGYPENAIAGARSDVLRAVRRQVEWISS